MRSTLRTAVAALALATPLIHVTPAGAASHTQVTFEGTMSVGPMPCLPGCGTTFTASLVAGTVSATTPAAYGVPTGLGGSITVNDTRCDGTTGTGSFSSTLTGTNVVGARLPAAVGFTFVRVQNVAVLLPPDTGTLVFGTPPPCTGTWSTSVTGHVDDVG